MQLSPAILCFWLVGFLFTGYALLDGFDLGIGAIYLFSKIDKERRIYLQAIAPNWDANEVWLVAAGGVLFAAFPAVYSTFCSALYPAFMLLLFSLIMRAAAVECRNQLDISWWRTLWDMSFGLGSALSCFLLGMAIGNVAAGFPITRSEGAYISPLWLFNPYALLCGIVALCLFMIHGSTYLAMKTTGSLRDSLRRKIPLISTAFIVSYVALDVATLLSYSYISLRIRQSSALLAAPILVMLLITAVPYSVRKGAYRSAFLASAAAIVIMLMSFGIAMFPVLIPSRYDLSLSLSVQNAAASQQSLFCLLVMAAIGLPLVLLYTSFVYKIFRGPVKTETQGY